MGWGAIIFFMGAYMKKVILAFGAIFCAFGVDYANAARLDVSRLTQSGEFSATFGAAFKSGENKDGTSQTDITAGRVHELVLDLDYTFLDDWTISFSTDNDYADSQVGIKWKWLTGDSFKLDLMADYGIAWTKNARTDNRIGANNIDFGARIHGVAWRDFQWALKVMSQVVFASPDDFWNINLNTEAMYYFRSDMATKVELEYNFRQIAQPTQYDRAAEFGIVYNMSGTASVHPYIKYHFKTENADNDNSAPDDWWKFGVEFSVEF